jgi:hypothetical protein
MDWHRLAFMIRVLLRPFGLATVVGPGEDRDVLVGWPDYPPAAAVHLPAEWLRSAFAAVSGLRELGLPRGRFGRVASSALAGKTGRPWVSDLAWDLALRLAQANPAWRPTRRFTVFLTHDVDRVHPFELLGLISRAGRAAKGVHGGDLRPGRSLRAWLTGAMKYCQLYDTTMRIEHEAGAVATYFFMSGPYSIGPGGARSGTGSRRLKELLGMVRQWGHRPGLHGCIHSLARQDYARQRKTFSEAAGQDITWHRNHYLVYSPEQSPRQLEQAGLEVDSSCAFHDLNGFRAGMAHPYPLWDLSCDRPTNVMEIPLVFMDVAAPDAEDIEKAWSELYGLLEQAEKVSGGVAVLFHVDHFIDSAYTLDRYAELLGWLTGRGANLAGELPPGRDYRAQEDI